LISIATGGGSLAGLASAAAYVRVRAAYRTKVSKRVANRESQLRFQ
jgi:hypothetical protein